MCNSNTISEAITSAVSMGAAGETAEGPAVNAYRLLKNLLEARCGKDSDLCEAVAKLEQKPTSESRRGVVREEVEAVDIDDDSDIWQAALKVLEALQGQAKEKKSDAARRINVKDSRVGVIGDGARIDEIHFHDSDGDWENFYLKRLIARCDPIDLAVMEETYHPTGPNGELPMIRVSDVFTTLYLKHPDRRSDQTVKDAIEKRDTRDHLHEKERIPIQAVEAAAAVRRVVMLGRPGGGKSTLVNYVAAQLARRRMGRQAEGPSFFVWPGEDKPLPVRIILRRMAAWITEEVMKGTEGLVWKYLAHLLDEWGCSGFLPSLKRILDQEGGVIFFDGLDEVGEADEARKRIYILQALRDFAAPLEKCRVIVTCREYAYRKSESPETANWRLPEAEFPVCEIDLFRDEQIQAFARAWYRVTGGQKGWNEKKCIDEADAFHQGIMSSPHLTSLGENPLLLTLMAQIHGRLGYLPKDRADLYERAVKLLLAHWDNRIVRDIDGTCRIEPWIIMRLGVPVDTLRGPLERVALSGHENQEQDRCDDLSCADIAREDLRQELAAELNDWNKAEEFIAYVQDRAGLLQAVDNRTFVFPHRTFQEYLAATGIMRKSNFEDVLIERLRRAPSWWQEVFLLAAGSTRDTPRNIYQLLDAVLPEDPATENLTAENCRLAQIAARAIYETDFLKRVKEEVRTSGSGRYSKIHRRIQNWLMTALAADTVLSPRDRSDAGDALNWVEDPRFDPANWYLPGDELAGFIKIPAGPFLMGTTAEEAEVDDDEMPQHRVELSEYYIGKYPVTVAQFRVFLRESGHNASKGWENSNRFDNHPAVEVSWQDAIAYCKWLTDRFKYRGWLIQLPSEAQWERAARGTKGWQYPWGTDKIDPNRANYIETEIHTPSPVGCFPGGASPCGAMDMIGNVWEWCLDRYQDDFYAKSPPRDPSGPSKGSLRVIRGGSWSFNARLCRAASRYGGVPGDRYAHFGFRLVFLPGQPG
jgi:formylglycine-generating enzyme required for sulfatase activity